jgi:DNA-binding response OmpR family regulator
MMRALWIDQDLSFVKPLLAGLGPSLTIQHLNDLHPASMESIEWEQLQVVLMEMKGPNGGLMELVPHIRAKKPGLPVLIVTAHANTKDCIDALNSGVNGLLEKPVALEVLRQKIDLLLQLEEELALNHERKAVHSQGQWVDLTSTEYRILECLRTANRRLTRSELQALVWPGSSISENNLDTHLTNLKKKIPELNQYLNVKRGLGYFLSRRKS